MATKRASLIEAGEKIYTTEGSTTARLVLASYALGDGRWAFEVKGVPMILQVEETDQVRVYPY